MKKTLATTLTVTAFATLVLAGCNAPETTPVESVIEPGSAAKNLDNSMNDDSMAAKDSSPSSTSTKTTTSSNQQGTKTMSGLRTLEDFEPIEASSVTIKTNKGDVTFDIFMDKVPLTATNFVTLAKDGFYDGIVFHRVIPGFMAQVGDPLTKDPSKQAMWGTGGPGYAIEDEYDPTLKHDGPGIVSMANSGPNTGGSQIFITYEAQPHLDGKHAVFGKVTSGMDVLESIEMGDTITSVTFE